MGCIQKIKHAMIRLGLLPAFTPFEVDEAEIENSHIERAKVTEQLQTETDAFMASATELKASTEAKSGDLERLLVHLRKASKETADARSLLEDMMKGRRNGQGHVT